MVDSELSSPTIEKISSPGWLSRVLKYTLVRTATLFFTVAVSLYLTILILNLGGYVDEIFRGVIADRIGAMLLAGWLHDEPEQVRTQKVAEMRQQLENAYGLNRPFLLRTLNWLVSSMTLELGYRQYTPFTSGWKQTSVQAFVLRHLPYTLVVVGAGNVLVFFSSLFSALVISRKPNSFLDRLFILLTPFTSAPSWIHGLLLVVVFAGGLKILPMPRAFTVEPTEYSKDYFVFLLPYMILPATAVFTSIFFQSVYSWRNFFLLYRDEPYVEVARAMGLSSSQIERRYILRPTLPYVITNFTMQMVGMWQGAIALEVFFNWPGIAALFLRGVRTLNTPVSLAVVVIFDYLLALSVLVLDVLYALVDPRVGIGSQSGTLQVASKSRRGLNLPARSNLPVSQAGMQGSPMVSWKERWREFIQNMRQQFGSLGRQIKQVLRYPSAAVGVTLIMLLVITAITTICVIPYDQAVSLWRSEGGDWYRSYWHTNPRSALPAWINFFRQKKLPETITLNSLDEAAHQEVRPVTAGITEAVTLFQFDYPYDAVPDEMVIYLTVAYKEKYPYISYIWITPDGRQIDLGGRSVGATTAYYVDQDPKLELKLKQERILDVLFLSPGGSAASDVIKGKYQLRVSALRFEPETDVSFEVFLYGKVHGLAGTDSMRRDLLLPLLWGLPVALVFGFLGAIVTNLMAMIISAFSAWRGGWLDGVIQRTTEINLMLPVLPIAILVYILYSKSIWVIMGTVVLLGIFGSSIKNYRSVFLQLKQSPYIEAAHAYGASDWRITRHYLVPYILPVLIPQIVVAVPGYVFYEATLAYLGVSDPYMPTWGKVIYDAITNNALINGKFYWLLEPVALLLLTGLAFVLLGFSLERVLNPRLRES